MKKLGFGLMRMPLTDPNNDAAVDIEQVKQMVDRFIEKGFNRLKIGGRMVMVTKRRDWYRNKLIAIFGGVKVREIDGYFVFEAERRDLRYANRSGFIKRR